MASSLRARRRRQVLLDRLYTVIIFAIAVLRSSNAGAVASSVLTGVGEPRRAAHISGCPRGRSGDIGRGLPLEGGRDLGGGRCVLKRSCCCKSRSLAFVRSSVRALLIGA